jgi:hypothetical protein
VQVESKFFLTGFSCRFLTINEMNVQISELATLTRLQGRVIYVESSDLFYYNV